MLRFRFGIGESRDYTLEELGERFSLTRERIRQIEQKALRALRSLDRQTKTPSTSTISGSHNRSATASPDACESTSQLSDFCSSELY